MGLKKTRKHKKQNKHNKTIPEIRKTLESISSAINTSDKSLTLDDRVKKFMKDWKKGVGKNIPYKLAREYVELRMRSNKGTRRRKLSTKPVLAQPPEYSTFRAQSALVPHSGRKHSGGMAPLDYETRPGIYGGHGQSLPYVSHDTRGFWGSGISGACGLTPKPNMSGGDLSTETVLAQPQKYSKSRAQRALVPQSGGGYMTGFVGAPFTGMNLRLPSTNPASIGSDIVAGMNGKQLPGQPIYAESLGRYHGTPTIQIPGGNITRLPQTGTIL